MNISEEDRKKIVAWGERHSEIAEVYLYGSRARGDNRPDSDIDLAIVMDEADQDEAFSMWFDWHSSFEEAPDLNLEYEAHVEWYAPDAKLERVGPGVEQDGILIYPPKSSGFS